MYELYDEYLGRDFSSDYWSDEGISQAGLILSRFTDSDWSALATSCLGKPEKWGIRCAETQEYMDDSANHEIYDVNTIANYSPDIVAFLDSPPRTAFARISSGKLIQVPYEEPLE